MITLSRLHLPASNAGAGRAGPPRPRRKGEFLPLCVGSQSGPSLLLASNREATSDRAIQDVWITVEMWTRYEWAIHSEMARR